MNELLERGSRPLAVAALPDSLEKALGSRALLARVRATWTAGAVDREALDALLSTPELGDATGFVVTLDHGLAGRGHNAAPVRSVVGGLARGRWRGRWAAEAAMLIACSHFESERWEPARQLAALSLECLDGVDDHDEALVGIHAASLRALTAVALDLDAEADFDDCLALVDAHLGPLHVWRAYVLADRARYLCHQRRHREAHPLARRAAEITAVLFAGVAVPPRLADVAALARRLRDSS